MFTSAIWLTAYEPALEICYLLQHRNLDLLAVTEITLIEIHLRDLPVHLHTQAPPSHDRPTPPTQQLSMTLIPQ